MRIWLAPSAYSPAVGGVETVTARLACELTARGHDVLVLTHLWPAGTAESSVEQGVAVLRTDFVQRGRRPSSWTSYVRGARAVDRRLAALPRPDVVHLHCVAGQARHLARYCARHDVPLVVTTHGETAMDEHQVFQRSLLRRLDLRLVAERASHLTACSAWTRAHAATVAPPFSRAVVIGNGVDIADWTGLPEVSAPVFAAYGRHVPQKGFDVLLRAIELVRDQLPDAQLLIGGSGSETERLISQAGSGTQFLGPLDKAGVRGLLGQARVVVVPSRVEPFGLVALEALAAGRRLVFSDVGGLAEVAGPHGWRAAPDDPQSLASAMLAAHVGPHRGPTPAELANTYSWDAVADSYERLY